MDDDSEAPARQLEFIRDETRFEIGLLHDRVNALLAAEAFLTIAYTAAMSNGTSWGARFSVLVAPMLSILGLLLALLALPGINTTVGIVLEWTERQRRLLEEHPWLSGTDPGTAALGRGRNRSRAEQQRGMLFFRVTPILFAIVWAALSVVALALRR